MNCYLVNNTNFTVIGRGVYCKVNEGNVSVKENFT